MTIPVTSQQLERLLEVIQTAIFVVDAKGIITWVNAVVPEFFGYDSSELIGKPYSMFLFRGDRSRISSTASPLAVFLPTEEKYMEFSFYNKSGIPVPIRMRSIITRGENGSVVQAVGIIQVLGDVEKASAGINRLNEKMWEAQQTFENILENSSDAIIICDTNATVVQSNKAFPDMVGYDHDEIMGKHISEFTAFLEGNYTSKSGKQIVLNAEYVNYAASKPVELFEKGFVNTYEGYFLTRDNLIVPIEISMSVLKDKDDNMRGSVVICRDISQRKQTEEEREKLIIELKEALAQVKTLSGLLPICASCKKIRDDKGYWNHIEKYIKEHSEAEFSHGICPECIKKLYPEELEEE
jgi:PAS domain S-box-containing protein